MDLDKQTLGKLKKYSMVFKEAKSREANESNTVMYLIKFFEEVLGYDSLSGEITKEIAIKDRYCDFGIRLDGNLKLLIEGKAAGNKNLREKDIEQAGNYASHIGLKWILLTNGIEWKLFHLSFTETEGIGHDEVFSINFIEEMDQSAEKVWDCIGLLKKESLINDVPDEYYNHKKALSPACLVKTLFSPDVLVIIRRELNKRSDVKLEIKDVFEAIKNVISKDALLEAGDISLRKKRRKRKKNKLDTNGKIIGTEDVEEEVDDIPDEKDEPQESTNNNKPKN
jgi:hypothetical protein